MRLQDVFSILQPLTNTVVKGLKMAIQELTADVVEFPLSQKQYLCIVDACDADLASLKWSAKTSPSFTTYVSRTYQRNNVKRDEKIHRIILERVLGRSLSSKELVDHVDGNGLNNRRYNLRLASPEQNQWNARKRSDNASGYKGVSFHNKQAQWRATISVNGKPRHVGYFDTPEEAYAAYCEAAYQQYGEFARLE